MPLPHSGLRIAQPVRDFPHPDRVAQRHHSKVWVANAHPDRSLNILRPTERTREPEAATEEDVGPGMVANVSSSDFAMEA